ncbi:MAG: hypothetical protein WBG36_17755 [Ornithinimicrobium sp.]
MPWDEAFVMASIFAVLFTALTWFTTHRPTLQRLRILRDSDALEEVVVLRKHRGRLVLNVLAPGEEKLSS